MFDTRLHFMRKSQEIHFITQLIDNVDKGGQNTDECMPQIKSTDRELDGI